MIKVKFKQYRVRGKNRYYDILVPDITENCWTYYESWEGGFEIDADAKSYKQIMYACALLSISKTKIIYLPTYQPFEKAYFSYFNYDAVLLRPETGLRLSDWRHIKPNINRKHQIQDYVLQYDEKMFREIYNRTPDAKHKIWRDQFEYHYSWHITPPYSIRAAEKYIEKKCMWTETYIELNSTVFITKTQESWICLWDDIIASLKELHLCTASICISNPHREYSDMTECYEKSFNFGYIINDKTIRKIRKELED